MLTRSRGCCSAGAARATVAYLPRPPTSKEWILWVDWRQVLPASWVVKKCSCPISRTITSIRRSRIHFLAGMGAEVGALVSTSVRPGKMGRGRSSQFPSSKPERSTKLKSSPCAPFTPGCEEFLNELLHQNLFDYFPMHIGQPKIPPLEFVRQSFVIDPQLMQQRCLEIVHVHRVLDHVHRQVIGLAV